MNWIILVSLFFALNICPFATGQDYTYSYGNSRVNVESLNGRSMPSSTYIGQGTMSKSAQGINQYGSQVNPGLPKVNRGNYIGTPGDNLYTMNPLLTEHPQNKIVTRPSRRYIYKQQPKKPVETYTADPNVPLTYNDFQADSPAQQERIINTTGNTGRTYHKQTSP